MKKKKWKVTIGGITNSRGTWGDINPVTRIKENKKKKNDRKKVKTNIKNETI
jgi:hypothetical protein